MIYFTSDLHLGYESVIKISDRPFSSIEEMDEVLIENWNKKVRGNDTVYIVGDLIWKGTDPEKYLSRLKGRKILIVGNHDSAWMCKTNPENYFYEVNRLMETSLCEHAVTLCHYPMLEWKGSRKIGSKKLSYLIHGHTHAKIQPVYAPLFNMPTALNAGVDINGYEPVTFDELVLNNEEFKRKALEELGM